MGPDSYRGTADRRGDLMNANGCNAPRPGDCVSLRSAHGRMEYELTCLGELWRVEVLTCIPETPALAGTNRDPCNTTPDLKSIDAA